MVAGSLATAGYFMGEKLHRPKHSNPKGFFEDREINSINEDILAPLVPWRPPVLQKWIRRDQPLQWQRWLARIPLSANISASANIARRIHRVLNHEPYCFKDPRFSYTLPAWQPYLDGTRYVCVFREPANTVASILKECSTRSYLQSVSINSDQALELWTLCYEHIFDNITHEREWIFLHFDQVLDGNGLSRLERFTGAKADHSFPDPAFKRSTSDSPVTRRARRTYERLCELAGHKG